VTKDEAKSLTDESIAAVADAIKLGWAVPSEWKERDFDALRGRPGGLQETGGGDGSEKEVNRLATESAWRAGDARGRDTLPTSLRFIQDGRQLVTVLADRMIRVWDATPVLE